jgi:hypothetical protein
VFAATSVAYMIQIERNDLILSPTVKTSVKSLVILFEQMNTSRTLDC